MSPIPTQAEIGFPVEHLPATADIGPARALGAVRWFVIHKTEGSRAGDLQVLRHADRAQASAHFWISTQGEVVVIVPLERTAWTSGNQAVDRYAVNIELEGYVRDETTDAQYQATAALFRWCVKQGMTGVPAEFVAYDDRPGIIGHQHVANPNRPGAWGGVSGHTDPGPKFDWGKLVVLIKGATLHDAPAPPPTVITIPETGKHLGHGFKDLWQSLAVGGDQRHLRLLGYPLSDEFDVPDIPATFQVFERAILKYDPNALEPWRITVCPPTDGWIRAWAITRGLMAGSATPSSPTIDVAAIRDGIQAAQEALSALQSLLDER